MSLLQALKYLLLGETFSVWSTGWEVISNHQIFQPAFSQSSDIDGISYWPKDMVKSVPELWDVSDYLLPLQVLYRFPLHSIKLLIHPFLSQVIMMASNSSLQFQVSPAKEKEHIPTLGQIGMQFSSDIHQPVWKSRLCCQGDIFIKYIALSSNILLEVHIPDQFIPVSFWNTTVHLSVSSYMCVEVYVFVVAYETDRAWKNCFCEWAAVRATTSRLCVPCNIDGNKWYVKFVFILCCKVYHAVWRFSFCAVKCPLQDINPSPSSRYQTHSSWWHLLACSSFKILLYWENGRQSPSVSHSLSSMAECSD